MYRYTRGRVRFYIDKDPEKLERGLAWVATLKEVAKKFQIENTGIQFRLKDRSWSSTRLVVDDHGQLIKKDFGPYHLTALSWPSREPPHKKFHIKIQESEFTLWAQKSLTNKALIAWLRTWAPQNTEIITPTNRTISLNGELLASANSCYVYFILNSDSNAIKIGKAKNVERRLKSLQTGSPADLELLSNIRFKSEQEAIEEEYRLHQKFKTLNIRGEWFRYDSDLKDYLSSLKKD